METQHPRRVARHGRPGLVLAGVGSCLVGVFAALALWLAGEQSYDDGVAALARAPVGCETVVDIETTGELLVYAEVTGRFDETTGDCAAAGSFVAATNTPAVNVDVTGPDGELVPVEAATGSDYDRAGFQGVQVGRFEVTSPGDHLVRVTSDDGDFALAIGEDPSDGVFALRAGALIAVAAGIALGVALVASGRRSPPPSGDAGREPASVAQWWETDDVVHAPPQRPAPPRIPGQPSGPGWPASSGERAPRVPGQPSGPGRGGAAHGDDRPPERHWAPPNGEPG